MFSIMLFIFLCFLGMLAVLFHMLRSQERLCQVLRDEHAQMRVLLRAMESRLDALDGSGILDKIVSVDMTNRFEIYFWYEDRFYVYMGTVDDAEIKTAFLVKVIEKLGNNRGNIDVSDTREASFSIFE